MVTGASPKHGPHHLRHVSTSHIRPHGRVWKSVSFVNRHGVGAAMSHIQYNSRGPTGRVEGEDRGYCVVQSRDAHRLEEDFSGAIAVQLRREGNFRQEEGVFRRGGVQILAGEDMLPEPLHILPSSVGHRPPVHRTLQYHRAAMIRGSPSHVYLSSTTDAPIRR